MRVATLRGREEGAIREAHAVYGLDRQWLIERMGVEPDVVADNRPDLIMQGRDPKLEKAVELALKAD